MIIIEPCAGLGNKLLGMSSAYAVAQKLNRELIVMWKREVGCNVKAEELFELPFRVIEISENGYSKEPVAHFRGNQLKKKWRAKADRFLECGDVEAIKKQKGYEGLLAVIEKEPVIYIKSFGPLCELDAASLAFLKPSAGILQKGEPLFSQLGAKTVGVHVRRTDHTEAIANSPLSLFADKMRQEMIEVPGTDFFVATDDEGVKRELREALPDAKLIFHDSGIIDRNSKEGICDAYIEMLALSRCRKILGSYNSTFSLLPSYIGDIPLEVVKKD